jgi:hypothetical protein
MPSVSISLPVLRCIYKGPARLSTLIPDGDGGWLNAMPLDTDMSISFEHTHQFFGARTTKARNYIADLGEGVVYQIIPPAILPARPLL